MKLLYHGLFLPCLIGISLSLNTLFIYIYFTASNINHFTNGNQIPVTVSVLDIGQGDSIFIHTPGGSILIDSGPPGGGLLRQLGSVIPFYKNNIEMMLATHEDADHIGGFPGLIQKYFIPLALISTKLTKTSIAVSLQSSLNNKHINTMEALRGMRIKFNWKDISDSTLIDSAHLDILYPTKPNLDELNTNELSIVGRFEYGSTSIMLTGDSPIDSEQKIVSTTNQKYLKSDVLKVGHHGSKNSSGDEFLKAVQPQYAAISVGADNKYGHPNQEALDRIASDTTAEVLRTDKKGTITFLSNGREWKVSTARDD